MAKGERLPVTEAVVRGLMIPYYNAALNRISPSAFTAREVSVSRLSVLSLDAIVRILQSDHDGRVRSGDVVKVSATATLTVADVEAISDDPDSQTAILPVEDPVPEGEGCAPNPSHALLLGRNKVDVNVPKDITRGMANKLIQRCRIQPVEAAAEAAAEEPPREARPEGQPGGQTGGQDAHRPESQQRRGP